MVRGLNTVLAEMEGIYNGIDVRVAALRKDRQSHWQSCITVIRYSYASKNDIERQHKKLRGTGFVDQPDNFMVGYKALSVDDQILERQGDGTDILKLSDITNVYYWSHHNPNEASFNYADWPEYLCEDWAAMYAQMREDSSHFSRDEFSRILTDFNIIFQNEKADAIKMGFNSISQAIKHYLQTRNQVNWDNPTVYYILPFYVKMSKPYYKDGHFCVDVKRHFKLSELMVNYNRGKPRRYSTGYSGGIDEIIAKNSCAMQSDDRSSTIIKETIKLEDYKADVLEKIPEQIISVSLGYPRLNLVLQYDEYNRVRGLLGVGLPQIANPLFASFGLFCSEEDFKKMLLEAHLVNEKQSKLKHSQIFERAVAWLLELGGYRSIWLGDKEKWHEVSGFEYGSADILALNAETRRLYVIGCSLKPPKQAEVSDIARMSKEMDSKLFGKMVSEESEQPLDVIPVYFYASKKDKGITEFAKQEGVLAISSEIIISLYEELKQKGSIGDFKELENFIYMQGEAI